MLKLGDFYLNGWIHVGIRGLSTVCVVVETHRKHFSSAQSCIVAPDVNLHGPFGEGYGSRGWIRGHPMNLACGGDASGEDEVVRCVVVVCCKAWCELGGS